MRVRQLLPLLIASLLCLTIRAADTSELNQRIAYKIAGFPGKVSLFAENLQTGVSYGLLAGEPVRTASTIKLPVMIECFAEAGEGKLQWAEPLTVSAENKVSGSGVLTEFSDGVQLPLRDLMHLMIVMSDNTATNVLLDRVTGNAVNARMAGLGFQQTRVMRKILGDAGPKGITTEGAKPENRKWGIGRSSPREMVEILDKLYHGSLIRQNASAEMLAVMKRQQDHSGIGRDLNDITIANKSGALDHLRSDVGIVYSARGPVAMAITVDDIPEVNWTVDNPGSLLISALSDILIDELGMSSKAAK
jgi:beta-lactamase class A